MKLVIGNPLVKNASGWINLIPESLEDLWHAYNLISKGDAIEASVKGSYKIEVENLDLDTKTCTLLVKGRQMSVGNQLTETEPLDSVMEIQLTTQFSLIKTCWDSVALDRIDMILNPNQDPNVAVVLMQEGLANVCLVTGSMTIVMAKVEVTIPRKRKHHVHQHETGLQTFYDGVLQAVLGHINFDLNRFIILASPGFLQENLFEFMMQWASKSDNQILLANKSKFLLVHSFSGFKHSLKEVLADPAVKSKMTNTKAIKEVTALDHFYSVLQKEPSRAFYGLRHILKANESKAIDSLLLTDNLFRAQCMEERRKYVELVESVRDNAGEVLIFSSLHVSGEQLMQLTGVAAVLRFAMPELESEESDSDVEST